MSIEELREAFSAGVPVEYTAHCQMRMMERSITRKDIAACILHGEIIENYPLKQADAPDATFPSCLILWVDAQNGGALHVVVGYNGRKMIIISAYRPDPEHFEGDYKTRKEK